MLLRAFTGEIPLTFPLLRNGSPPLPLSREPEVPAVASGEAELRREQGARKIGVLGGL